MLFVSSPYQLRYSILQRDYNFDVQLPEIGGISPTLTAGYCQDIKFGDYSIDVNELKFGAFKSKYAGDTKIEDVTMTFLKSVPDLPSAYFYDWRDLIIDESGYYGIKSAYAKSIYVYIYDVTGFMILKAQLVGAFPKSLPDYNLSYSSEKISTFSVTFSVDRISFHEFTPANFVENPDTQITEVGINTTSTKIQSSKTSFVGQIPTIVASAIKTPSSVGSLLTAFTPVIMSGISYGIDSLAKWQPSSTPSMVPAAKPSTSSVTVWKPVEVPTPSSFAYSSSSNPLLVSNASKGFSINPLPTSSSSSFPRVTIPTVTSGFTAVTPNLPTASIRTLSSFLAQKPVQSVNVALETAKGTVTNFQASMLSGVGNVIRVMGNAVSSITPPTNYVGGASRLQTSVSPVPNVGPAPFPVVAAP